MVLLASTTSRDAIIVLRIRPTYLLGEFIHLFRPLIPSVPGCNPFNLPIPTTKAEIEAFIRVFDVLLTLPDVNTVTLPSEERDCFYCRDHYDSNIWQRG